MQNATGIHTQLIEKKDHKEFEKMTDKDYEKYAVDGLKRLLKTCNRPVNGNKAVLIQRLIDARQADEIISKNLILAYSMLSRQEDP